MKKIAHVHDKYFRAAMADPKVARSVFEQHLPESLHTRFDWTTLHLRKETHVNHRLDKLTIDALYSVTLRDDSPVYLYILAEAQTAPDPLMPWRMLNYTCAIIAQHLKEHPGSVLPLVIPLVIYAGDRIYNQPTHIFDLFGKEKALAQAYMFNQFTLVDLSTIPDEELARHHYASLLQLVMKHVHDRDFWTQTGKFLCDVLYRLADEHEYIYVMLKYAIETAAISDKTAFFDFITASLPEEAQEGIMTLAEQLKAEGFNAGIHQGMQQGMQQGEHHLFIKLLKIKFTTVPENYLQKIDEADEDQLLLWGERLMKASSLQEIFVGEE
jgi:predicted transposase/invertase (TIGR01784 family)